MTLIFYVGKYRLIILPKDDAAAVWIIVFTPSCFAISTNPIAVNGFTKLIDACSKDNSYYIGTHWSALANAYWAYVPVDYVGEKATFLPVIPHPINPPPFYTTRPLASNPNVQGVFLVSEYWPFSINIVSDGLIGAAITLIRT